MRSRIVFFLFICFFGKSINAQVNFCFSVDTLSPISVGDNSQDVVSGDFNNDNNPDLVVANSGTNSISVLLGNGNGTFLPPVNYIVGSRPIAVCLADFDEDGILDILVANSYSYNISLLTGNANGTFNPQTNHSIGNGAFDAVCADFNGDNHIDVAVSNQASNYTSILLGSGAATFSTAISLPGSAPRSLASADFNNDGNDDLAIVNLNTNFVSVFLATSGGFSPAVQYSVGIQSSAIVTSDFNGDGVGDLAVTNFSQDNKIYILIGNGNGTFSPAVKYDAGGNGAFHIMSSDFNNDGKSDIAIANHDRLSLLYGTGTGAFQNPITYANENGVPFACADFNNDAKKDLAVAKTIANTLVLYLGNGNGGFDILKTLEQIWGISDVIACDLNNDNEIDFIFSNKYMNSDSIGVVIANGPGSYAPCTKQVAVAGEVTDKLTSADFNGDGKSDLAFTRYSYASGYYMTVALGNGSGIFTPLISYSLTDPPTAITSSDYNLDGYADIAVVDDAGFSQKMVLYMNNGNGSYSISTYNLGLVGVSKMRSEDLNNDGYVDICIVSFNTLITLMGNGTGIFTTYSYGMLIAPTSITVGDFNSDGKKDLAIGESGTASGIAISFGAQTGFASPFKISTAQPVESLVCLDINNDGHLDLAGSHGFSQKISFFINDGSGNFSTPISYNLGAYGYRLIDGDFNNDGLKDIAVAGKNNLGFFFNKTASVKILGSACIGSTILQATKGASSYSWNPGASVSDTMHVSSNGIYQVTLNNSCGVSTSSINVNLNPPPVLTVTVSQNTICAFSTSSLVASGAINYYWSNSQNTSSIVVSPTATSVYSVIGTDTNSCSSTYSVAITVDNTCADVWPGDANSDGTADNLDVLELGLHYTLTGASRASASSTWQSYFANNWTGTITNGKNLNHSDCNGDGIINDDDTLAIYNNYGLTHAFKTAQTTTVNPQLSIVPDQSFVVKGTWGTASINLGNATNNINNINGVAFTVDFDNTLIETNNIYIQYQNSFLDAGQNLDFRKLDFANGKIYTANTHTVNNNVSGFGKIATLHYQIKSTLSSAQVLNFGITQAVQSDASGTISPLTSGSGSLTATIDVGLLEILNDNAISVNPNPSNGSLTINSKTELQKIEVVSITGQVLLTEIPTNISHTLNLESFANGIYFVNVYQNDCIVKREKIVLNK